MHSEKAAGCLEWSDHHLTSGPSKTGSQNHDDLLLHAPWDVKSKRHSDSVGEVPSGNVTRVAALENTSAVSQEVKDTYPHDSTIPLLDIYPREMERCSWKNFYASVHNSIARNSQQVETT